MTTITFLILFHLAVWSVTRLVIKDELPLVRVPRDYLVTWLDPRDADDRKVEPSPFGGFGRAVAYLFECAWCMSVWVGGLTVWLCAATGVLPDSIPWWLLWISARPVAGWLGDWEARTDQRHQLANYQLRKVADEFGEPRP